VEALDAACGHTHAGVRATSLRACTPGVPLGVLADGTDVAGAFLVFVDVSALLATENGSAAAALLELGANLVRGKGPVTAGLGA